jgi:hypothetical protein
MLVELAEQLNMKINNIEDKINLVAYCLGRVIQFFPTERLFCYGLIAFDSNNLPIEAGLVFEAIQQ